MAETQPCCNSGQKKGTAATEVVTPLERGIKGNREEEKISFQYAGGSLICREYFVHRRGMTTRGHVVLGKC
jgi:hypothetical protein